MNMDTKHINPEKLYSLTEVVRLKLFDVKSYPSIKTKLLESGMNIIKVGEWRGRKYFIKGKDLIKFFNK
jgi:hypothetical protein